MISASYACGDDDVVGGGDGCCRCYWAVASQRQFRLAKTGNVVVATALAAVAGVAVEVAGEE